MYAVHTEVTIPDGTPVDGPARGLQAHAIPAVRAAGAVAAYWMEPANGSILGVVLFDDETAARTAASGISVGGRPPDAPDGVSYRTVEVREVIARL
ncbi:MAG TPA: hypothetical protein VFH54_03555 [Mycobacteriales bacterium]|nr:hypothetical protein [Mycobacteriales bacterium]